MFFVLGNFAESWDVVYFVKSYQNSLSKEKPGTDTTSVYLGVRGLIQLFYFLLNTLENSHFLKSIYFFVGLKIYGLMLYILLQYFKL